MATGNEHIGFNNSVFLSERDTADRFKNEFKTNSVLMASINNNNNNNKRDTADRF